MPKLIGKAALDGFLHALILLLMNNFLASTWAVPICDNLGGEFMLVPLTAAGLSVGEYALLLRRVRKSCQVTTITLLSIVFCLLTLAAGVAWMIEFPFRLFPVREGNAGDGMLLLFATVIYLLFAGALRIVIWIAKLERCVLCEHSPSV